MNGLILSLLLPIKLNFQQEKIFLVMLYVPYRPISVSKLLLLILYYSAMVSLTYLSVKDVQVCFLRPASTNDDHREQFSRKRVIKLSYPLHFLKMVALTSYEHRRESRRDLLNWHLLRYSKEDYCERSSE